MTTPAIETSVDLSCHRCGYDLRAQRQDGRCPECGASVAESRQWAAIPRLPAWRDSDPPWRRRVLAGTWVLVLLPLVAAMRASGWASEVRVPTLFDLPGSVGILEETLAFWPDVHRPLIFCVGMVLLFSKERGRRPGRLDWTRRWGVGCSYAVLLLSAAQILYIVALVAIGIAALFLSMPGKYQPGATRSFVEVGAVWLRYGPHPKETTVIALVGFSSTAILLACVQLFGALRRTGPSWLAAILLAPLALFSLVHLAHAVRFALFLSRRVPADVFRYTAYFQPALLVDPFAEIPIGIWPPWGPDRLAMGVEAVKACVVFGVAAWLGVAQFAAWRRRYAQASAA
ncbi:MAG: hypothetical protein JWO31_641 [Phycisphaerales bacterium]|nr:hypothetical protein [Phycisphaerales bacterium]